MIRASGTTGRVYRGYQPVAVLGSWSLSETGSLVSYDVQEVNEALLDLSVPLSVRLSVGSKEWRWREAQVESVRPVLRATVAGRPVVV